MRVKLYHYDRKTVLKTHHHLQWNHKKNSCSYENNGTFSSKNRKEKSSKVFQSNENNREKQLEGIVNDNNQSELQLYSRPFYASIVTISNIPCHAPKAYDNWSLGVKESTVRIPLLVYPSLLLRDHILQSYERFNHIFKELVPYDDKKDTNDIHFERLIHLSANKRNLIKMPSLPLGCYHVIEIQIIKNRSIDIKKPYPWIEIFRTNQFHFQLIGSWLNYHVNFRSYIINNEGLAGDPSEMLSIAFVLP
jgi:hypothetical protein